MANTSYSCVIPVKEEHVTDETGTDHFWVLTSDVLPGFVLGGRDLEALHSDVPDAIRILFKENYGVEVNVFRVIEPQHIGRGVLNPGDRATPTAWTAVPLAA